MSSTGNTNFLELYFEHKNLMRIVGEPTFGSLHVMLLELKANAISVPYNLGGGSHGYAECIIPPIPYTTIAPLTPFIVPLHLDP